MVWGAAIIRLWLKMDFIKRNRKGNLLIGNVVYIVIVILFMASLFIFVGRLSSGGAMIEEKTAKKIALIIDSAKPQTLIFIYIDDLVEKREGIDFDKIINIEDNIVNVRLSEGPGYSYSFFNNVKVEESIGLEIAGYYLKLKIT